MMRFSLGGARVDTEYVRNYDVLQFLSNIYRTMEIV